MRMDVDEVDYSEVLGVPKKRQKQIAHCSIDIHLNKHKAYQIEAKHVKILLAR